MGHANSRSAPDRRGRGLENLCLFVLAMWVVELGDRLLPALEIDQYGIHPRERSGLIGIACAPFLHGDFLHLAANSAPLAILGLLIVVRGGHTWIAVTLIGMVLGGLGVWLIGRPGTNHIGASGIVFAYLAFLLFSVWWRFSLLTLVLAIVTGVLYGGLVWGMLPGLPGISWEGHLCGFVSGIISAWLLGHPEQK